MNTEEHKAKKREYYLRNREEILSKKKQRRADPEYKIKYNIYRNKLRSDPEIKKRRSASQRAYAKTPKGIEVNKKHVAKHRRELGFEPINDWFPNSDGHHINNKYVIYIPLELHKKYPHNHNKLESMFKINLLAFDFLINNVGRI